MGGTGAVSLGRGHSRPQGPTLSGKCEEQNLCPLSLLSSRHFSLFDATVMRFFALFTPQLSCEDTDLAFTIADSPSLEQARLQRGLHICLEAYA